MTLTRASSVLAVAVALALTAGCDDEATSLLDRPPALALRCAAEGALDTAEWGTRRWPAEVVQSSSAWCRFEELQGQVSRLAPLAADGALGPALSLAPSGDGDHVVQAIADGPRTAVLFDAALDDARARYFVVLDAGGEPLQPPAVVPDGRVVSLGDGTFGLLSASHPAIADELVLRVLGDDGAVLDGPDVIARFALPAPQPEDAWYGVTLAAAPDGFVVSAWGDPEAPWLTRFDRAGAVVFGPLALAGSGVLAIDDTLWIASREGDGRGRLSVHVSWVDADGRITRGMVTRSPWYAGTPSLSLIAGHPLLAWSVSQPFRTCPQCSTPSTMRLAALTRDIHGDIVRASDVVSLDSPDGLVSHVAIALFGDDLLVGTTAIGHAWHVGAMGRVRCVSIDAPGG